jgi:hypothetical protein
MTREHLQHSRFLFFLARAPASYRGALPALTIQQWPESIIAGDTPATTVRSLQLRESV